MISPADPVSIGSGPHDPDPPPPPPQAVLDAIGMGATWEAGALRTVDGLRWLHVERGAWVLRDWKDAAHGCALTLATFNALALAAAKKAPWEVFGQPLGLVPRDVKGNLVAELTVVGPAQPSPL